MGLWQRIGRATQTRPAIVFRWDLDKTYLQTDFDSLRGLVRVPFEKPEDKVAVPGVVPLIRGLREAAAHAGREAQIFFISASPAQLAKPIKQKLALDGIAYDGIVFKDQLGHLVRGRFRSLREHVGFKLTELLKSRRTMPAASREVLFGDDWESDPIIYSLYADILAGRIDSEEVGEVLRLIGVHPASIAEAKDLAATAERGDAVMRIYISLERRTPPTRFRSFGSRLVPTFNYLQTAVCLFADGYLALPAVAQVAESLIENAGYTPSALVNSVADLVRRGHVPEAPSLAVRAFLSARGLMPAEGRRGLAAAVWQRVASWSRPAGTPARPATDTIDYHTLVSQWRGVRLRTSRPAGQQTIDDGD
ncbi:MAG: phosphatase domain-containing protein [Candidatus Binatia bacterium]